MANVLHKSQMTIKTSLAALESKGLILRKRQGAGHPNRIYVKFPKDAFRETDRKLSGNKKERVRRGSPYGNFQNVFLSAKELENVRQTVPNWQDYIERLSGYMASIGKQYQNHAATIISWALQDNPPSRQKFYESEEYETL